MSYITSGTPTSGPGSGTVTSISAATGITLTPNPITTTGTVGLTIPVVVTSGGTGFITATTAYAPICAGTTATGAFQVASTGLATTGFVLTSNGASALPSFQAVASGITTIDGDTGSATGATVTFDGNSLGGSSVKFVASGSTVQLNFTDPITGNLFIGNPSGNATTTAIACVGLGPLTLFSLDNSSGASNIVAIGTESLFSLESGSYNCAVGTGSGTALVSGEKNSILGSLSFGQVLTGNGNCIFGFNGGAALTTSDSFNILIGDGILGSAGNNNVLRIGVGSAEAGADVTTAFIGGIAGVTVANTAAVLIDTTTGQLGTVISSERYKDNIVPMEDFSDRVLDLAPKKFNYKSERPQDIRWGLIAEEVEKVFPELVVYKDSVPETVMYHELPVLLLDQIKKLNERIKVLENK